jgi:hypothetical protein
MADSKLTPQHTIMSTRKKKSDVIDAIPTLDENEQIVIEDTKRIRREKMANAASETETEIIAEPVLVNDAEPDTTPRFSETSIAALLYDDDPDELTNQFCTIHVRRKPDKMRDAFLTPCTTVLTLPAIQNVEVTAERSDIEEIVRQQYGGGHYFFQVRFQNRLSRSWEASLADPPEAIAAARAKTTDLKRDTDMPSQPVATNPLDQFLETLKKQRELQDLLFGDERRRLESEIERLRQETQQTKPATPQSDLALLLEAMQKSDNPGLIDFAREYLSGEPRGEPQYGMWDFLKYVFDHRDALLPLVAGFLGGGAINTNQKSIENVLRQPPSGLTPVLPVSKFNRKTNNSNDDRDNTADKTNG